MTEPLKFFKIDDSTIYQDGFSYSFHRILDPPKSSPDQIQLQQSFNCQEENCRSRCHVNGNWEMDKKGRKFMLGIVKKEDHTHRQEYRDTTPKLRFYKNNDENIHRNGFDYTFYRELDPPKQIADFQWHRTYRCALSDQENCRARIYTTGQWEENKRELHYQLGIFKNCIHSHESEQHLTEGHMEYNDNTSAASGSYLTRNKDLDKKEHIRFYKYKHTSVQRNGFVYNFNTKIKGHPLWEDRMFCQRHTNGQICNGYIWTKGKWKFDDCGRQYKLGIVMNTHNHEPYQISFQGKDNDDDVTEAGLKFYQYKDKMAYRDGFVYSADRKLKSRPPWKYRMRCSRYGKNMPCKGAIWTTGEWETDKLQRHYQRGIPRGSHCHKAYEQFLNEDDTTNVAIAESVKVVN